MKKYYTALSNKYASNSHIVVFYCVQVLEDCHVKVAHT